MGIIKEMVSLNIFFVNPDSKYLIYIVFLYMEKTKCGEYHKNKQKGFCENSCRYSAYKFTI